MSDDLILADAIYAAGQALHVDACTEGDPHDGCDCGDWDREAEIAVRAALPSIAHARDDVPTLLTEVRRLRAMEQRVREYARHLARPFADGVPDREGEQIASELLAALDGGER